MQLRVSGAMAIVIGLLQAYLLSFEVSYARDYGRDLYDWYAAVPGAVNVIVFTGAGLAAQFRISAIPLTAAWGWLLGMTVPHLLQRALLPLPQIPAEFLHRDIILRFAPDYVLESSLIVIAFLGIVLCYLDQRRKKTSKL